MQLELHDQDYLKRTEQDATISSAISILENRARYTPGQMMLNPSHTRDYLRLKLSEKEHEVFFVIFLDNQHRLIKSEEMFQGTIDGASVYPREVAKVALECNAAAVILAHNHPSGVSEPSQADMRITEKLKSALLLLDIRILDHMIVGDTDVLSFAEKGLL